jgi:hypothetical protein
MILWCEVRRAGSAGNPHATCDVAGAGNGAMTTYTGTKRERSDYKPRRSLRAAGPVLDPTKVKNY